MIKIKQLAFYLLIAAVLIGGQFVVTRNLVSGAPPLLAAATLDGKTIGPQIQKGPALIYFWADWCGICRAMQGAVDSVLRDYPGITVAMQSGEAEAVRKYLQQQGLRWPTIADADGAVAARYRVTGVPAAFIIDAAGQIRFTAVGYSSAAGLRMRLWLAGFWH